MSSLLSVLAVKDSDSSTPSLFYATEKEARNFVRNHSHASSSFIETIADLDQAHFMTMYEMHEITKQLDASMAQLQPRDRLRAAVALAEALSIKQMVLPKLAEKPAKNPNIKVFPPYPITKPCKKGTKMAVFLELLAKGATTEELGAAVGWKPSAVKSGLNHKVNKVLGFGYSQEKINGSIFCKLIIPSHHQGPIIA